jgi:hypothetical protein
MTTKQLATQIKSLIGDGGEPEDILDQIEALVDPIIGSE